VDRQIRNFQGLCAQTRLGWIQKQFCWAPSKFV
jgi:hypothetical protein